MEAEDLAEVEEPVEAPRPQDENPEDQRPVGRPVRQRNPPDRYGEWAMIVGENDPKTYEEAIATDKQEVYIKQPKGFEEKQIEHLVCRGLVQSKADPCVYTKKNGTPIVAVYVDDILIATETSKMMEKTKKLLFEKFEVKDLGQLESFLGVKITITKDGPIWFWQPGYTKKILERFRMVDAKPVNTPIDVSQKLIQGNEPGVVSSCAVKAQRHP